MEQARLNALLTIFIEQEIAKSISFEEIIDEFKTLISFQRRMLL
jgi:hypothetical protein